VAGWPPAFPYQASEAERMVSLTRRALRSLLK
jgi:hypothetical protein